MAAIQTQIFGRHCLEKSQSQFVILKESMIIFVPIINRELSKEN